MTIHVASTRGWHCLCADTGKILCSGRKQQIVSTIALADGLVLAACPELAEVHSMMSWWDGNSPQVDISCHGMGHGKSDLFSRAMGFIGYLNYINEI